MSISRQVDTSYFTALVGEARAPGVLARAGLAMPGTALPDRLDMVDFWRCCAQNIQETNDESHGVAAQPVPRGSLSVLITATKEADDLAGALRRLTEAMRLLRKDCHLSIGHGRGIVRLNFTPAANPALAAEIYTECFAVVIHCALRWMTGQRLDPLRVRGSAALKAMGGELLEALHAPIARRGSGVSIDYAAEVLTAPILPQKYTVWGEAEFANFVAMVGQDGEAEVARDRGQVLAALGNGLIWQDDVAAALGLSVATLRRRLAAQGTSFRAISSEFRVARLRDLLATGMQLADIAERLGLSDDRSLRRFCVAHFAQPPAQLRRTISGEQ
jgi:AraC-like DNA-binding protein